MRKCPECGFVDVKMIESDATYSATVNRAAYMRKWRRRKKREAKAKLALAAAALAAQPAPVPDAYGNVWT